ncbi:hypothetical protein A2334_00935 [Candidatus Roizmanbacteria bacterium RIFOXYB2_FULL_38_10]|nr:MAG: hypothetical protein A2334_00935 [Candidatus Roizmanbacteria bacterium RIFOXYB2_FULL_38_10]OGK73153.1 MAG: hypothetical protein A2446_00670 [Candidatus Roizmanbacteria bacterium RIFOXYC2_FULL_38_9]
MMWSLASYKLAMMIAVLDQTTYDASKRGCPIPSDYVPPNLIGDALKPWEYVFNEPLPTFGGLCQRALGTFKQIQDPSNPLTAHIPKVSLLTQLI